MLLLQKGKNNAVHVARMGKKKAAFITKYCTAPVTNLGIIHHNVVYLKYNFSETEPCLRLQVDLTQVDAIDSQSDKTAPSNAPN
jgi:hypothetical protein